MSSWTGLGLDCIRIIANFIEVGLDPECKSLQNTGSGPDLDWINEKEMRIFVVEMLYFSKYLDLGLTFEKNFGLCLDLDWV